MWEQAGLLCIWGENMDFSGSGSENHIVTEEK